ncbi:MAG: PHP domain-containing protein [Clostridiales bacterium]|jgi:predicted metal-dependent phosphoesterase TrpH|nr:PHP domain-containing protein [Clostridiales bacterium]
MTDLHIHTRYSDGTDTCSELLGKLILNGITTFSITDHDFAGGNFAMIEELNRAEAKLNFVTGIEVSSIFDGTEMHLLGYGFDLDNDGIKKLIENGSRLRREKLFAMFNHLESKHGIFLPEADKDELKNRVVVGKPNVVALMIKNGIQGTVGELIERYLDDLDTESFKSDARRVIEAVLKAGGAVSLAHPIEIMKEYGWDFAKIGSLAKRLKDVGLTALEVFHSSHGQKELAEYKTIADKYGLLISGGSDYHGELKTVKLGRLNACGKEIAEEDLTILSAVKVVYKGAEE